MTAMSTATVTFLAAPLPVMMSEVRSMLSPCQVSPPGLSKAKSLLDFGFASTPSTVILAEHQLDGAAIACRDAHLAIRHAPHQDRGAGAAAGRAVGRADLSAQRFDGQRLIDDGEGIGIGGARRPPNGGNLI